MIERFDHLVIGVRDLEAASRSYADGLGFDVRPGGRHTGRGTHNAIIRFGLDYLELISVYDEREAQAAGREALPTFLSRHAGGLVAYALATSDIEALAARCSETGLEVVGPFAMERLRPDGTRISWRLLVPGGDQYRRPWPFFIQWDEPDGERLKREEPGTHPNGAVAVQEVAIVVEDIDRGVDLYSRQLGLPLTRRDEKPDLAATSALYGLGAFRILLLAPRGAGPVRETLENLGEGLLYSVLAVSDLGRSRRWLEERGASVRPAPGVPEGLLLDLDRTVGARLILQDLR